ncbi:MAG: cysteine hydrolase [Gammaproteobacteria bacterium]|nr:cysteine hydrolase [Gammaproteobacteria bacterium]MBI5614822.1 cysteine hydrolase [Gammaproteobacteria bacterium]
MTQALVLIDLQNDYFPGGAMTLVGMEAAAERAARVLDAFRSRGAPIVHLQHVSTRPGATFFLPDTPGVGQHASVAPRAGEAIVRKHFPNSFRDSELGTVLANAGADALVIVGAMSHMCVDATTRQAFDLGFECTVIADACATRDLQFGDEAVPAAKVHAAFMAALSAPYARVIAAGEFTPA